MSGGYFEYKQWMIDDMADTIEGLLKRQGKKIPKNELWRWDEEGKLYETYPEEVQAELKKAVYALRRAAIYAQRIDWYLSGDDGEEEFIKRLEEELIELNEKQMRYDRQEDCETDS